MDERVATSPVDAAMEMGVVGFGTANFFSVPSVLIPDIFRLNAVDKCARNTSIGSESLRPASSSINEYWYSMLKLVVVVCCC